MELVRLGKKGQVTIPKGVLRAIGIPDESSLLIETTEDGAIVLRPAAVYPIEMYSDTRIAEFEREQAIPDALADRARALYAKRKPKK